MNKKPPKLNIPNEKDQFIDVPFVKTMTEYQLKVLVKRLWNNFQEMAEVLQENRPDVSHVIDMILSGDGWNPKDVQERHVYVKYESMFIQYDTKTKTITFLDSSLAPMGNPIQGFTLADMKARRKAKKEKQENMS